MYAGSGGASSAGTGGSMRGCAAWIRLTLSELMIWRWSTVLLLVYAIIMYSFWWTERHSLWGAWRQSWEARATAQWEAEQRQLWHAFEEHTATFHGAIPERRKWTRPKLWHPDRAQWLQEEQRKMRQQRLEGPARAFWRVVEQAEGMVGAP